MGATDRRLRVAGVGEDVKSVGLLQFRENVLIASRTPCYR